MLHLVIQTNGNFPTLTLVEGDSEVCSCVAALDLPSIRRLGDEVNRILSRGWQHDGGSQHDLRDFAAATELLGHILFDANMCSELLQRSGSVLCVELPLPWLSLPWELAAINGQHLNEVFAIGRIIQGERLVAVQPQAKVERELFTVWANPEFNLTCAEEEGWGIRRQIKCSPVASMIEVEISCEPKSRSQFVELLQNADFFHFAGHGYMKESSRTWKLLDGDLASEDLSQTACLPKLVFAHSCGSGQISSTEVQHSLPVAFMRNGAQNYLGLRTPILDHHAIQFSRSFYERLINGIGIGTAALETHRELKQRKGWNSMLCANYVLYGNPANVLFRGFDLRCSKPIAASGGGRGKAEGDALQFPVSCCVCERQVKSRFLVHSVLKEGGETKVVCSKCGSSPPAARIDNRPSLSQIPLVPSIVATVPTLDLPAKTTCLIESASADYPRAWKRLLLSLQEARVILDPETGCQHNVQWIPEYTVEEAAVSFRLASTPKAPRLRIPVWTLGIRYCAWGTQITREQLRDLVFSTINRILPEATQNFVVLVVPECLPREVVEFAASVQMVEMLGDNRSLLLVELNEQQIHFRKGDLHAQAIRGFFDWESKRERLTRITDHIERQRPLEISLAATDVANSLNVPLESVLVVFRNLTASQRLKMDQVQPYGWVLSEFAE